MDLKKICVQARDLKRKYRHPKCGAVVVAAGSASRMGGTDKILTKLGGIPVICHSLAVLDACDMVDEIVVVARKDCVEQIRKLCSWYAKVKTVVPGGDSRVASTQAGLAALSADTKLAAVHDGARPLVTADVVAAVVQKAAECRAAAPAVPVKDTIKEADNAVITSTPDRSRLFAVQTPQVFDADLLRGALQNAQKKNLAITDDCSAVEALGVKVHLVPGSEENIKITTPLDLKLAEMIWKERNLPCESDTDTTSTD